MKARMFFSGSLVFLLALAPANAQTEDLVGIVTTGTSQDVQAAIDKGADVNTPQPDTGVTPLIAAAKYNPDAVQVLLKAGADTRAHDVQYGGTALMWAAYSQGADLVRMLLAAGADVKALDGHGATALMWAAQNNLREGVAETLLSAGAVVNAQDNNGATALILAAKGGNTLAVLALLRAGANARLKDSLGNTALSYALYSTPLKGTPVLEELQKASK